MTGVFPKEQVFILSPTDFWRIREIVPESDHKRVR